jgi:hypothetical protein
MNDQELLHEIDRLTADNAKLKEIHQRDLECLINSANEIDRLRGENESLKKLRADEIDHITAQCWRRLQTENEQLHEKLAVAVETLEKYSKIKSVSVYVHEFDQTFSADIHSLQKPAKEALSKIRGDK